MNLRTDRPDYQARSDPAVMESADRGQSQLLSYGELYNLWERQQWAVQDIDFTQDRIDWHERIPEEERYQRMYGLSSFFIGEQKVAEELGPMMRAFPRRTCACSSAPRSPTRLATWQFFDRFYSEVGVLESDNLADRLEETSAHLNENFGVLFDEMLGPGRSPGVRARGPGDTGRGDHALPHGDRGDAGAHRPALHHRVQRVGRAHCPGSWRASATWPATSIATWPSARASCATWPERPALRRRDPAHPGGVRPGRRRRAQAAVGGRERETPSSSATRSRRPGRSR